MKKREINYYYGCANLDDAIFTQAASLELPAGIKRFDGKKAYRQAARVKEAIEVVDGEVRRQRPKSVEGMHLENPCNGLLPRGGVERLRSEPGRVVEPGHEAVLILDEPGHRLVGARRGAQPRRGALGGAVVQDPAGVLLAEQIGEAVGARE